VNKVLRNVYNAVPLFKEKVMVQRWFVQFVNKEVLNMSSAGYVKMNGKTRIDTPNVEMLHVVKMENCRIF